MCPDGTRLAVWTEWFPNRGEVVRAALGYEVAEGRSVIVSGDLTDVFRPTALVSEDADPLGLLRAPGRTARGGVGRPLDAGAWLGRPGADLRR